MAPAEYTLPPSAVTLVIRGSGVAVAVEAAGVGAGVGSMFPPVNVGSIDHVVALGVTSLGGVTCSRMDPLVPPTKSASLRRMTRLPSTTVGGPRSRPAAPDVAV